MYVFCVFMIVWVLQSHFLRLVSLPLLPFERNIIFDAKNGKLLTTYYLFTNIS